MRIFTAARSPISGYFVDGKFLAVMDVLTDVPEDTSVQINFHMDSAQVIANSEKSFAASVTLGANVTVYGDRRLKPALVPAKISTRNNVWHDTMIVRFEAEHLEGGRYGFLSVICPAPAGGTAPDVTEIEEEFRSDGTVEFRFVMAGCWYVLELCGKRLSVRSEVRE